MQRIAVIPAYEPPKSFYEYAESLTRAVDHLIVVNDGSDARYEETFSKISSLEKASVISYSENRGKGYALKRAFLYCAETFSGQDIIVTADCDGQHSLEDVCRVCEAAERSENACVLGVRDFTLPNVPARSKAGNNQMRRLLRWVYGLRVSDSQTGLRAFSVKTALEFVKVKGERFEYETGTLIHAKRNGIALKEVAIETIYPDNPQDHVSHFKTFRDSFRVIGIMLRYLLGNMAIGLAAEMVDFGVFALLAFVLFSQRTPVSAALAAAAAKVLSAAVHYPLNRRFIYRSRENGFFTRYLVWWALQTICSCGAVYLLGNVPDGSLAWAKLGIDCCLGLAGYLVGCNWVYLKREERFSFYGPAAKFARGFLCLFSRCYKAEVPCPQEPVVYVCRHLNMHGPYCTLKWLPFHVHPMILHTFFDREDTVKHMSAYTFSERYGRKQPKFSVAAHIAGLVVPPIIRSLQAIPVYRGENPLITFRQAMRYLQRGESCIVYPDMSYTSGYDDPSDLYSGFLYLGSMYSKKTGRPLSFVPLLLDDEKRTITAGEPVRVSDFRKEGAAAAEYLKKAINRSGC